jgi:hypothetical protein
MVMSTRLDKYEADTARELLAQVMPAEPDDRVDDLLPGESEAAIAS